MHVIGKFASHRDLLLSIDLRERLMPEGPSKRSISQGTKAICISGTTSELTVHGTRPEIGGCGRRHTMRYMGSESNRGAGFAEGESALATIQYFDSRSETGFWEMCRTAHIWSHKSIHGSNELEVEEIIANEPATLEQIFVAEMHP